MVVLLSLKNAWLPTFLFSDSNNPCYDLFFPHSDNLCKNTSVLGGTVLKLKVPGDCQALSFDYRVAYSDVLHEETTTTHGKMGPSFYYHL